MIKEKYLSKLRLVFMLIILSIGGSYFQDKLVYAILFEELTSQNKVSKLDSNLENVELCFTPEHKCTSVIIKRILDAKKSIYVQGYGLTSIPIMKALLKAHEEGVSVKVLLDKSNINNRSSRMKDLITAEIDVKIDRVSGIAHNKVMIIDEIYVITGSFNFTNAADLKNVENVIVIRDSNIAREYLRNWKKREAINGIRKDYDKG